MKFCDSIYTYRLHTLLQLLYFDTQVLRLNVVSGVLIAFVVSTIVCISRNLSACGICLCKLLNVVVLRKIHMPGIFLA